MNFLFKLTILILITWCFIAQLYFIALPFYLWYLFKHKGYELIVISIFVDGYYQAFYSIPILSVSSLIAVYIVNLIKPHLLMYTGGNEVVT